MRRTTTVGATLAITCFAASALAVTLPVPSEFPSIQSAVDAAAQGDTVLVAPGTYSGSGNKNIDPGTKEIVLMGEMGAESTIIDCEGAGRGLYVNGGQTEALEFNGFTVRNGWTTEASAVFAVEGSSVTIRNCVFEACASTGPTAAVRGRGALMNSKITSCTGNWAFRWHAGLVDGLEVIENEASSGAVDADEGPVSITNSVFLNNGDWLAIAAINPVQMTQCVVQSGYALEWQEFGAPSFIENCTIIGEVRVYSAAIATFRNSIFNSDTGCGDLEVYWGQLNLECCRYDPSTVYDDEGLLLEVGPQVYADPEFCGDSGCFVTYVPGSLELSETSPCLAENSPCGERIGAYDLGCGVASTESLGELGSFEIRFLSEMPATGSLAFELGGAAADQVEAEIVSSSGRVLLAERLYRAGGAFQTGSLDGLSSGVYFLRVRTGGGEAVSRKFVRVSR